MHCTEPAGFERLTAYSEVIEILINIPEITPSEEKNEHSFKDYFDPYEPVTQQSMEFRPAALTDLRILATVLLPNRLGGTSCHGSPVKSRT